MKLFSDNVKVILMVLSSNPLQIQVPKHDVWHSKQPKIGRGIVPSCPMRICTSSPSGAGKSVWIVDMITRIYAGCFERIFVFSPSVDIDSIWTPVRDYVRKVMGVPEEEECFSEWNEDTLAGILATQRQVVAHQKKEKVSKEIYQICIVIDDWADDPRVMGRRGGGSAINTLMTRGRHIFVNLILSSQKIRAMSNIIRINLQSLIIFKLRSALELDTILEEVSIYYDKKTLLSMYEIAVAEPYSFWYINLAASRKEDVFWLRFEQRMIVTDAANALEE